MERLRPPTTDTRGVTSATVSAPALDPRAVLDGAGGGVRGFWARGERWVIHWGSAAEIRVDPSSERGDRFSAVRERARAVFEDFEEVAGVEEGVARPPRFYGGVSFRPASDIPDPCWRPFGSASFVLPEVEIAGRRESARVTVRSAADETTPEQLLERARALAESLAADHQAPERSGTGEGAGAFRREEGDVREWRAAVEEALSWIRKGRISKVVLARTLDLLGEQLPEPGPVALDLWEENPGTHVFLFEPEPGAALVGAAPETVATVLDGSFKATAVAGSISRGTTPAGQEALAYKLLESEKDRMEHAIAVQDMVQRLRPLAEELSWDSEPHVLTLSRIQHLETQIQARLAPGESVLSVLEALHPTPAV
ncbi:MAG: chorismate-binding protein, partial [Longimicrobiales bacterium]|nr:chorismate-binding protein [Longimicrobiales bacterium]